MARIDPVDDEGAVYPYERADNESSPTWHPAEGRHVPLAEARRVALDQLAAAEVAYADAVVAAAEANDQLAAAQREVEVRRKARLEAASVLRGRQNTVQRLTGIGRELID